MSHRALIKSVFDKTRSSYTIREIAEITSLPYTTCQKRMSDLYQDGVIIPTGTKEENGNDNSVYSKNPVPAALQNRRKSKIELLELSVRKSVDERTAEAIFDEYNRLKNL